MHLSLLAKTTWVIVLFSATSMLIGEVCCPAAASTNGAPAGRTGSPGDVFNCTSCHPGSATTISGLITSDIPLAGYIPGQTYTITGSITSIGKTKFGFQVSPQDSAGSELGTLVITDPAKTKLVGTTGNYVTHLTAGTSFPAGTATWSFDWIAPAVGTGDVTFYGAFNITNNNNNSSGDAIRLSTLIVQENVPATLNDIENLEVWNVYPNPFVGIIHLNSLSNSKIESLKIFDITGKLVRTIENVELQKNKEIDISDLRSNETYLLNIVTERGLSIEKIIKIQSN